MQIPETEFAHCGDIQIAYQVYGSGPLRASEPRADSRFKYRQGHPHRSELPLEPVSERALRGVPGRWSLYEAPATDLSPWRDVMDELAPEYG